MRTYRSQRGFTLVEILIVVIILGILAAVVIPQFTSASQDARKNSLASQLQTLRSQIELYKLQHRDQPPPGLMTGASIAETWEELINKTNEFHDVDNNSTDHRFGPYLQSIPRNPLNGFSAVARVTDDPAAGATVTGTDIGFVFNTRNHKLWGTSKTGGFVYDETNPARDTNDQ